MAQHPSLSTRVLLTCAAIGVATGLLSAGAGYLSVAVAAGLPLFYGLILGAHVLPGVVAQALLRQAWVALVTHLIAALVASALAPQWTPRFLGTAILIGGIQEGVAALSRYRRWEPWRFIVSALVIGAVLAATIGLAADVGQFPVGAQIVYLALFLVSPAAWTVVGLAIAAALRRAGVARTRTGG
ncbi:MAG TPA: ECF transporter S component [Microbacterium sp.]|uniref:ECF transporter S component n=1 Tax=Microbacterium sp. TaxID=51671 RepID=UPI002CCFEBE6|nr:ECF transporter S component [Microbacterium sp.]HWI30298.1 ECF transporter S component [Microbacterium sp.]